MDREQRDAIIHRLETYLGYSPDQSSTVIREVCAALDIEDGSHAYVMTDDDLDKRTDDAYELGEHEGHRIGYMQAMDDVVSNTLIMGEEDETFIRAEIARLRADYIDTH